MTGTPSSSRPTLSSSWLVTVYMSDHCSTSDLPAGGREQSWARQPRAGTSAPAEQRLTTPRRPPHVPKPSIDGATNPLQLPNQQQAGKAIKQISCIKGSIDRRRRFGSAPSEGGDGRGGQSQARLGPCRLKDPQRPARKRASGTGLDGHGEPGSVSAPGEDKAVVNPAHSSTDLNQRHVTGDQSQ